MTDSPRRSAVLPAVPDTRPLSDPIDPVSLETYRALLPRDVRPPLTQPLLLAIVLLLVSVGLPLATHALLDDGYSDEAQSDFWQFSWLAVPLYLITALSVWSLVQVVLKRRASRPYRLFRFAQANGMTHQPISAALSYPGMIFRQQSPQHGTDILRLDGSALMIGTYRFTTGAGRSRSSHAWGFVSIPLGRSLPHIVLDAEGNNGIRRSNLPDTFDVRQKLELEGDFGNYFTLFCPRGYEADALYLFTPDIMARFIDHAAELDVEIIDNRLYLYSPKPLVTLDPEIWGWLFTTIHAVTEKVDQWERWSDDRLGATRVVGGDAPRIIRPPRGVAQRGRRLTQREHWIWLVFGFICLPVGLWGLGQLVVDIVRSAIEFVHQLLP